jgi:hypothetical protein
MLTCDFSKMSMPSNLHLAFQVLSQFEKQYNYLPKPWDEVCKNSTIIISLFGKVFSLMPRNFMN